MECVCFSFDSQNTTGFFTETREEEEERKKREGEDVCMKERECGRV